MGYPYRMAFLGPIFLRARQPGIQRAVLALSLACALGTAATLVSVLRKSATANERLVSAARELDALTDGSPEDDRTRAAIAWGYAERLRLGIESPFRLIDAAARDPRLRPDERRTVSWALLGHVLRGETHHVDPAALDRLGPTPDGESAAGEQHLELITDAIARADDPRAAELAVRLAYTLAVAERIVEGAAPQIAAEAAALLADREVARREAGHIVRSARATDPIGEIQRRRARRAFYVERPVLLEPGPEIEREAVALVRPLLDSLRTMNPRDAVTTEPSPRPAQSADFSVALLEAGGLLPPAPPLVVTMRRHAPAVRGRVPALHPGLSRVHNAEMLAAIVQAVDTTREQRRALGRLLLATGVAMRSLAQETIWFAGDSVGTVEHTVAALGLGAITFDRDVPASWQPYYLKQLADGVRDLRRVLPEMRLDAVLVRFRVSAPADSALAMHDPRSRTVHLPLATAGGTLTHELAHDLDRRSAADLGLPGYRSDNVARGAVAASRRSGGVDGRLAASLRALTDEAADNPRAARTQADRPAEIFATRVDWFVARALARRGISSGFLSAVQDEWLTGHVVHPDRLRNATRSRSLVTALTEMTPVAAFAAVESEPSLQTLLRWSLAGPVDRRVAAEIVRGDRRAWSIAPLVGHGGELCDDEGDRVELIRMAAESRARGWVRLRARWMADGDRTPWARSLMGQGPWSEALAEDRVDELRDYVLVQLAADAELSSGIAAYAAPLAARARCS